jgi:hypothetical protein
MSFDFLATAPAPISTRIYPLISEGFANFHTCPPFAAMRIRQSLEELAVIRCWTGSGYPVRGDDEDYQTHKLAHGIYGACSGVLHVHTIDPLDATKVRRVTRTQLHYFHDLMVKLYANRSVPYYPPSAPKNQEGQSTEVFNDILEELDIFDDQVCGSSDFMSNVKEENFDETYKNLYKKIQKSKLGKWEKSFLFTQLLMSDQEYDIRRGRFDDELTEERRLWISTLLQSEKNVGQYLAVECLRRRQEASLYDFHFEKALNDNKNLLKAVQPEAIDEIEGISLDRKNPLEGRVLQTQSKIIAFQAHAFEDTDEVDRAIEMNRKAIEEFEFVEDQELCDLQYLHLLVEKYRISGEEEIKEQAQPIIEKIDRWITSYLKGHLQDQKVRIDIRIAARLKTTYFMNIDFPQLKDIVAIVQSIVIQESHTQPWPQICGLICSLQPNSAPKNLRKVLEDLSQIKATSEEASLGWISRTYLLNYYYEKGDALTEGDLIAYEGTLPKVALKWWNDYGMKERFLLGCSKDEAAKPVCVLPFDFA